MSILSKPYFHDEAAAFAYVEGIIWGGQPICPKCGCFGRIYSIKPNPEKKVRMGLKKCGDCKSQFTVRIGTIFEESHLPMHKWLQAIYLMCSSKKGVSAKQLERTLEVTYKTAWFLAHRIREAMRSGDLTPFGSEGGYVEVDETFIGMDPDNKPVEGTRVRSGQKMKVLSLIDRSTGRSRSFVVDDLQISTLWPILNGNISREAKVRTDAAGFYKSIFWRWADHGIIAHHKKEYVSRDDRSIHTNTVEGFYSIFKRGMKGVYQHCSKKHLNRYIAEFDFRYTNRSALGCEDQERTVRAIRGVVGKRLTYRLA